MWNEDKICFLLVGLGEGDIETKINLMSLEPKGLFHELKKKFVKQPSLPELSFLIEYLHIPWAPA